MKNYYWSPGLIVGTVCVVLLCVLLHLPAYSGRNPISTLPYAELIDNPEINDAMCELHFLDVGYGDAIFMVLPQQVTVLIDGGYEEYGENVFAYIRPYLKGRKLDWIVCTHPHPDHVGGLFTVAGKVAVRNLIVNMDPTKHVKLEKLSEILRKRNKDVDIKVVARGDTLEPVAGVTMQVLHPEKINNDLNYSSLVFMLKYREFKVLLGGDIEQNAEKELTEKFGSGLHAHVLKLPHHGNRGFTGFVPEVKPLIGIITVAENEWGAPHEQTLGLLEKFNTLVLRTDGLGNIILKLEENGYLTIRADKAPERRIKVIP